MSCSPIFDVGEVTVTRDVADILGRKYSIKNVESVRVSEPNRAIFIVLGIALCAVGLVGLLYSMLGIIAVGGGIAAIVFAYSRPHVLIIRTGHGDQPALYGKKEPLIEVARAIATAVTMTSSLGTTIATPAAGAGRQASKLAMVLNKP